MSRERQLGYYLHPSIAFTPEGVCLGTLHANIWARDPAVFGTSRATKKQKPIEEKESYRWLDGWDVISRTARAVPQCQIINVSDRESDIYALLQKATRDMIPNAHFVIRQRDNRCLPERENGPLPGRRRIGVGGSVPRCNWQEPAAATLPSSGRPTSQTESQSGMESHEQLLRRIELFRRGVICPSEMWIPLFENLRAEDVPAFFNQLNETLRATVLKDYRDYARYRFSQAERETSPPAVQKTIAAINQWCEEHS